MKPKDRQALIKNKSAFISFVVPVYNEEQNIQSFLTALKEEAEKHTEKYEIVMVDDGSRDDSTEIIEAMAKTDDHLKLIVFSRNFGKENALTAGLQHCKGDAAIMIDADFQHPLECIPSFIDKWAEGYDMVYGLRDTRENESFIKRAFTGVFYRLLDYLSSVKIPPNAGDFRILDRKVVNAVNECGEFNRFMKGLYSWVGFKSTSVLYHSHDRTAGKSAYSFTRLFDLAMTGITSFSDKPLKLSGYMGLIISIISLIYALFIVAKTIIFGVDVPGFATITVAIMFFGGIQLISIGILGEYVARIFREVKHRPKYFIEDKIGFDE